MSEGVRDGRRHDLPRFLQLSRREGQAVDDRVRFVRQPSQNGNRSRRDGLSGN